ncbi:MAG: DNA polymerase III subunit delta' [Flavobacteriaceae bacterium]|nr:DNA polymerase III subunit delta' [Flavobacteriaceae bacterium]
MLFSDILGQEHIKSHLQTSADNGRIAHAQLFVGKEGCGTLPMALAYAQYLLCLNAKDPEASHMKCTNMTHPDMHFVFPVATTSKIKRHPISNDFLQEFRSFIHQTPYGNLFDWFALLEIENKQGIINVDEAENIVKSLQLKSYEGGYKVMVIWMAEKMNIAAANKLLKLLEEPPEKTVFILVSEHEEQLLNTIKSRCQLINFPGLSEQQIADSLVKQKQCLPDKAKNIAHQAAGNYNKALHILNNSNSDAQFEKWFITWVRAAFKAKTDASVIEQLIGWSTDIAATGRETQKYFLQYCLQCFRQALMLNYGVDSLVYLQPSNFELAKFAPFIHGGNILEISKEINEAMYHIERNGNAKIILLDTSIKLTRLLHKK